MVGKLENDVDLVGEALHGALPEGQRALQDGHGAGYLGQDLVASRGIERGVDAARHGPGRVDALPGEPLDDALAEATQGDAVLERRGMLREEPGHVARRRVVVHAQQQVGRGEVEEGEGVRLHDLGAVERPHAASPRWPGCARP